MTIKKIAEALNEWDKTPSLDRARSYVRKHYTTALPAYWKDGRSYVTVLDVLMATYNQHETDGDGMKLRDAFSVAIDHCASLIFEEWTRIAFTETTPEEE